MFERYTERARQVVVLGKDEAHAFKHDYIGTEHILLGLLREEEGLAARVLGNLDVTIEEVRNRVREIVGVGESDARGELQFTPRCKKALELGLREALSLGHGYIGTEHILLGLVRENNGVAARVLNELGNDAATIRNEIIRLLSKPRREPPLDPLAELAAMVAVLAPIINCPHIGCSECRSKLVAAMQIAKKATA